MRTQVQLVAAKVFIEDQFVGTVDGLADVDLNGLVGATFTPAAGGTAAAPTFAEGDTVALDGERFAGTGYVEMYKGDDLILRLTEVTREPTDARPANAKGRRVRVYAHDIASQVTAVEPPLEAPAASSATEAPAPTAPEGYGVFTGDVRDLDTAGETFYLSGISNEGVVTVLPHKRRARPSEKVYGQIASEVRSGRRNVKVSVTQGDVEAGRIFVSQVEEDEEFEHTDENAVFTPDIPVGTRISFIGDLAEGFGEVVAPNRNPKGVLSIRIANERNGNRQTRLALTQADLDAGKLARYDR